MPKLNGGHAPRLLQKRVFSSAIAPALVQDAETLYAGKQPQILMKFALTLYGARS